MKTTVLCSFSHLYTQREDIVISTAVHSTVISYLGLFFYFKLEKKKKKPLQEKYPHPLFSNWNSLR